MDRLFAGEPSGQPSSGEPFDIDEVMSRVREAVRPYPKPVLFALAEEGFGSPFEQLVACIISIRTREEVTEPTAHEFFRRARTPAEVSRLTVGEIDHLIRAATFHETKAPQIQAIAARIVEEHGGELPCDEEVLRSFRGVGPKCTNLVLSIACGQPRIAVDTHVHRIVNRWGYVHTRTPEQTLVALEAKLPKRYWTELNRLLVPFGKYVCTSRGRCSACPVPERCRKVYAMEVTGP
jgi:endonuclease-3